MSISRAILAAASTVFAATGHAAVTQISSATFSGGDNQVRTLTSVTISGTNYSVLEGSTSATIGSTTGRYWIETDPGSNVASVTGLNVSSGILNTTANFQFGRQLAISDTLFFFDLEADDEGDAILVRLINAAGTDVGSGPLTVDATGFGPRIYQDAFSNNADVTALANGSYGAIGVSFGVSDFTGDVSTATGFRVYQSGSTTVDPMVGGIATIPEPTHAMVAAAGFLLALSRRKR